MKTIVTGALVATLFPTVSMAVGLDRSGQSVDILFEEGGILEFSFGKIFPEADGEDIAITDPAGNVLVPGGSSSGNALEDYYQLGAGLKFDISDQLSMALILGQPYGLDLSYPADGSLTLGGTKATVNSNATTALLRYKFNENFSVHGGLRYQEIDAKVSLRGAAYGALSGYDVDFGSDGDIGFVVGGAYERPDIALRVAVTYSQGTEHKVDTTETLNGVNVSVIDPRLSPTSTTTIDTPDAVNLDFQTGIMADTLLFGSVRYAWYEDTIVSPVFFDSALDPAVEGSSLTDIDDAYAVNLGVGRRFNDTFSGSVALGYEDARDDLVSPLAPTNGKYSLTLAGAYNINEKFVLSGGVSYTWLGDAKPETGTPDTARADFEDNDAVAVGFKVGYRF